MIVGLVIVLSLVALIGAYAIGVRWGAKYTTEIICDLIKDTKLFPVETKLLFLQDLMVALKIKNNDEEGH